MPEPGFWRRVERAYGRAVRLERAERERWLQRTTGSDPALRAEVESLLACHTDAAAFFDSLGGALAALPRAAFEPSEEIPERLGRFEILGELGRGGMGVVYKARDPRLGRLVAIKVLPPRWSGDRGAKQRLVAEARAASAIEHPNIVSLYEIAEEDAGRTYLVLAYCEGETLRERLSRGPLPPEEAVAVARQVAEGLAAAHERRIVHRDIKPANLLLGADGSVKILDFGLAQAGPPEGTGAHAIRGTVAYMSPEQARGDPTGPSSDLWSLGTVLFEMLTGERPFGGEDDAAVVHSILHDDPLASPPAALPPGLLSVLRRLLAKDSDGRYASAADALAALEPWRVAARPRPPHRGMRLRRRLAGSLVGVALLVLGVVGFFASRAPPVTSDPLRRLAVLPFEVGASESLRYLGNGVADLLGGRMMIPGRIETVDAREVLGHLGRNPPDTLDETAARALAERLGADLFLTGTIAESPGRLRIRARLHRTAGGVVASSEQSAPEERLLLDALDPLAHELLAGHFGGAARGLRGAALSTQSLAALKAYVEGEDALRAGRFGAALAAFQRAVERDTLFALADYRLALAARWVSDWDLTASELTRAFELRERLSERERMMVEALYARHVQLLSLEAERHLSALLARYPDYLPALVERADLIFHETSWGVTPGEARTAYQRVLERQADHAAALLHLARLDALDGRPPSVDAAPAEDQGGPGGSSELELRTLRAFTIGGAEHQERVLTELRALNDQAMVHFVSRTLYFLGPIGTEPLLRVSTESSRPEFVRAMAALQLAFAEAARGRLRAAERELTVLDRLEPEWSAPARALLAAAPGFPVDSAWARTAWRGLQPVDPLGARDLLAPAGLNSPLGGATPRIPALTAGLIAARLGELSAAMEYARLLEERPVFLGHSARGGRLVRAAVAWKEASPHYALNVLGPARAPGGSYGDVTGAELFLRGEILRELGRDREALRWYAALATDMPLSIIHRAPSHLRRAEIHEGLGETEAAIEQYGRFIELWRDCDPELRPMVEDARLRLAALGGLTSS